MSTTRRTTAARIDLNAIGRRIRQIRGNELSQADLGRILGIGQGAVSVYERGKSPPSLEVVVRLRDHSGKSIDWIITGEN